MKFLLDTNICIYIIKNKPSQVIEKFKAINADQVFISSITISELRYGCEKSSFPKKNHLALDDFLTPLNILGYTEDDGNVYGVIRAYTEKKGIVVGGMDLMIAAQSINQRCILITNNTREFERIPGIQLENWVSG